MAASVNPSADSSLTRSEPGLVVGAVEPGAPAQRGRRDQPAPGVEADGAHRDPGALGQLVDGEQLLPGVLRLRCGGHGWGAYAGSLTYVTVLL
jgi:hypothetical protein